MSFETVFNNDGKPRAVNVRRPERAPVRRLPRRDEGGPSLWGRLVSLVLVVTIGAAGYQAFVRYSDSTPPAPAATDPMGVRSVPAPSQFSCDGRKHCTQMRSCEEATFFLRHCPGTEMDGDRDGVPCEQQWCG